MNKPIPFGKYCLLDRISIGGMAEVFKAKTFGVQGFSKIIAIKRILPAMAEDKEFVTMFIDEAKIAVQLNHANICQIYELGKTNNSHYIAMEYIHGKDLLQLQNKFKRDKTTMPVQMACYAMQKVCEGLDYAHRKRDANFVELNLVHRDISPQNIIVSFDGEVKIIDFGIAKAATRSTRTQVGVLKGKFGYMSPEQVRGLVLDRRSDIFAAGTVFYEILAGRRLFVADSDFATLEKVRKVDIEQPSKAIPGMTPDLEAILLKALAREREERYQWGREMAEDLALYLRRHYPGYSAKDLADWMRSAYRQELEDEKRKMEAYAAITRPADLLERQAAAEAGPGGGADRKGVPGPDPARPGAGLEAEATTVFAYNPESELQALVQGAAAPPAASPATEPLEELDAELDEDENEDENEDGAATEAIQAISDEEYARMMNEAASRLSSTPAPGSAARAAAALLAADPRLRPFSPGSPPHPGEAQAPSTGAPPSRMAALEQRGTMDLSVEDLLAGECPAPQPAAPPPVIRSGSPPASSVAPSPSGPPAAGPRSKLAAATLALSRSTAGGSGLRRALADPGRPGSAAAAAEAAAGARQRRLTSPPASTAALPSLGETVPERPLGSPAGQAAGVPALRPSAPGSGLPPHDGAGALPVSPAASQAAAPPSSLPLGQQRTMQLSAADIPALPLPDAPGAPLPRPAGGPAQVPAGQSQLRSQATLHLDGASGPMPEMQPRSPSQGQPPLVPAFSQVRRSPPPASRGTGSRPSSSVSRQTAKGRGRRLLRDLLVGLLVALLLTGASYAAWTLLLGPWWSSRGQGEAILSITAAGTIEDELTVLLDGKQVGRTLPLEVTRLAAGSHTLEIRSALYEPHRATVMVQPEGITSSEVKLQVKSEMMATLRLRISPGGPAVVYLNGRKAKELPAGVDAATLSVLPRAAQELAVKRAGHVTHTLRLTLAPQEQREETIELARLEGRIELTSEPTKAAVYLNDKRVGTTPFVSGKLDPDKRYDLRLTLKGYEEWQDDLTFDGDHPVYVRRVELLRSDQKPPPGERKGEAPAARKEEGFLTVSAGMDTLARVFVDGEDTGKSTPISEFGKLPLAPGEHTVSLKLGSKTVEEKVVIEPGKTTRLKMKLQ